MKSDFSIADLPNKVQSREEIVDDFMAHYDEQEEWKKIVNDPEWAELCKRMKAVVDEDIEAFNQVEPVPMKTYEFGPLNYVGVIDGRMQTIFTPQVYGQIANITEEEAVRQIEQLPEYIP